MGIPNPSNHFVGTEKFHNFLLCSYSSSEFMLKEYLVSAGHVLNLEVQIASAL